MTASLKPTHKKCISCSELDTLVQSVYKRPYAFQQQDDCKDRGVHRVTVPVQSPYDYSNATVPDKINGTEMGVSFAAWLAREPKQWAGDKKDAGSISLFWERNFYPNLDMLVNDLHAKGFMESGEYLIEIDW